MEKEGKFSKSYGKNRKKQLKTVFIIEFVIVVILFSLIFNFWYQFCGDNFDTCMITNSTGFSFSKFLLVSIIRPFLLTPMLFTAVFAGKTFNPFFATFITILSSLISGLVIYYPTKLLGNKFIHPWFRANLPSSISFVRSQDYKIIFFMRLIPVLPFDLGSVIAGIGGFRLKSFVIASTLGIIPETLVFTNLSGMETNILVKALLTSLITAAVILIPLVAYEYKCRKQGSSLWTQSKAVYYEFLLEIKTNNSVIQSFNYGAQPEKTPVLLLYGFFSSRRSISILKKRLKNEGFQVISFNLGGLFNTFSTRGVEETAHFVNNKLLEIEEDYGFKEINIVAHSKGGLVGLWWLLNFNGYLKCKNIITLGSPFKGTLTSYFALVTPLGFFWRDVWEMRPNSKFLLDLEQKEVPKDLNIFCFYSKKDKVVKNKNAIFAGKSKNIVAIAANDTTHFEYLISGKISKEIATILHNQEKLKNDNKNALEFKTGT